MGNEIGDDGTAGMQGGFVGQEFVTGGKLRLDQAKAAQEVRESQFLFDAQELRVLNDVRLRFYDSLVAQRQVELTDELVRISKQLVNFSQRLLAAQQLSKNDVLLSEIEAEESEILADNAHNEHTETWRRLAAVVGATDLDPQPLAGDLDRDIPDYDWEESYARAVVLNPELSAAEARVSRARIAIVRARQQNVPNVNVMLSAAHKNSNHNDVAGVQVGFPLPILDRNQGNIFAAESELIAASNSVRRIELELQDRLAQALRRYANAYQQANRYKQEILPRAQQSLDLVTRGYASGQVDFLTLLTSQRTYIRVNLAYLSTLDDLWQAATLIEGQLLSGSLQGDSQLKISEQGMSGPGM
jgi:cobalt-zinc-cadmium efflux system outer membrane protein